MSLAMPLTGSDGRWVVRAKYSFSYLAVPAGLILVWFVVSLSLREYLGPFFPPPHVVALSLYDWATGATGTTQIYSGELLTAVVASSRRIIAAYVIAILLGIPLGILVGWTASLRRFVDPTLQLLRPIPVTAWVPISMLWFGIGDTAAIYLVVLAAFFPIYLNTLQGVRYVDPVVIRAGRMLGASGWRLLVFVVLPAALPSIFAGLRISIGFAWMAVVASELVAVKSGLGYVMFDAYGFLRADIVIASMIVIGLLGFLSDRVMLAIERRVLVWVDHDVSK